MYAMPTANSEGCSETMIDRFSDLPDDVSHHILSFLTIPDLSCFGCVSKKFRQLHFSTPCLNFDDFSLVNTSTCDKRRELLDYLEWFLLCRGDSKIDRFFICWERHYPDDEDVFDVFKDEDEVVEVDESESQEHEPCLCVSEHSRMMSWILNAVRCNKVEELHLEIMIFDEDDDAPLLFPSDVFCCVSLKSLVMDMKFTTVKTPPVIFPCTLKHLELKNVEIEEGFFKWMSSCCKCIEELCLQGLDEVKNITIENSSLKTFRFSQDRSVDVLNVSGEKLEDMSINWTFDPLCKASLNVFAPNLRVLKWFGTLINHPNLGRLECLEEAEICLARKVNADFDNISVQVLSRFRSVKVLTLYEDTIKALFREGSMPATLGNVRSLRLHIGSFADELVPAMVSLFRGMPNVCTLYIKYIKHWMKFYFYPKFNLPAQDHVPNASGFSSVYWKLQSLPFIDEIQKVTIELSEGCNGIELAKYVLENAQNLKKMDIIYLPQQSNFILELLHESKMASNATVVFQKSKED